jgi:hypothetical protein
VLASGGVSAELKTGGMEAARSGTATAQQAVQGAPAQQLPWGHPELPDDGEGDAATDTQYWGAALGAACSGTSFAGWVTWCATGIGAGWWPAWAEARDGASRSTTMTAAAPTMRANRSFISMPSYHGSAILTRCISGGGRYPNYGIRMASPTSYDRGCVKTTSTKGRKCDCSEAPTTRWKRGIIPPCMT